MEVSVPKESPLERRLRVYKSKAAPFRVDQLDQIFFQAMTDLVAAAKEPYDMGRMIASLDALEHARNMAQDSLDLARPSA